MTGASASGEARIEINSLETEAALIFLPSPDAAAWDAGAINKLAAENKLFPPVSLKILEAFLSKAAKAKEPLELVLYRGVPPEDPVPETISWEDLVIPSELVSLAEELGAVPPEIYRVRIEKIKTEKTVKKPGALPFLPQKEEVVVTWDKREIREKVEVNPQVVLTKYAEKGNRIGSVSPPVPGKPGKSVFGKPLPPASLNPDGILLGSGIAREKDGLIALVSGFVRIGDTWADIVPPERISGAANAESDSESAQPEPQYASAVAFADTITEAFADVADEPAEHTALPGPLPLPGRQAALAEVIINHDKTQAVLHLLKGNAGLPLDMKTVSQAIRDSGVHVGDAEKLKADIRSFMTGNETELPAYVLAQGKSSVRGKNRGVTLLAALLAKEEQAPVVARLKAKKPSESIEISADEISGLAFVEKEGEAARVDPPSEGEAGRDIFGNEIPGLPGNDPDLKLYEGLELHGELIKAQKTGLLLFHAGEGFFRAQVIDYADAKIGVRISRDLMSVRCDLYRESGAGIPLTRENVMKVLAALGVVRGIDEKAVDTACERARTGGSCVDAVVARGEVPVAKGERAVQWLVDVVPPQLAGEDGTGGEPGAVVQVRAGTVIARFSRPLENGRPGFNVKGAEIPFEEAGSSEIEFDGSVREETGPDGKYLSVTRPGELSFDGKTLSVNSLREIPGDAGPATGNINFFGEVRVQGNVLAGFAVIGGLHVQIKGFAQASLISSGGNAVIAKGIRGAGKGVIRAHSAIEAAFAEKATLMAVGDIKLNRGAILCIMKTNGRILITAKEGKLLGGLCQARHGIDTADLGSETGGHTEISFGQDYLIKDQIRETQAEMDRIKAAVSGMDRTIRAGVKNGAVPEQARREKIKLVKRLEQLKIKLFTLEEKFEEHHDSELRIRGTVYPGVIIESHGRYYEVKQIHKGVVFFFDRETGRIRQKPLRLEAAEAEDL